VTLVDFRIPITQARLWVIDLPGRAVIKHVHVAHGSGTQGSEGGSAVNNPVLSNIAGSNQSSVGGFVTLHERTSTAGGLEKIGLNARGRAMVIEGLDSTNNRMQSRAILFHGAHYVGEGKRGMSHGCFSTHPNHNSEIINRIKDGSFGFSYAG
jgi:hypothetical protein